MLDKRKDPSKREDGDKDREKAQGFFWGERDQNE